MDPVLIAVLVAAVLLAILFVLWSTKNLPRWLSDDRHGGNGGSRGSRRDERDGGRDNQR